jgi:rhodanese-related sulfurtransferase
MSDEAYVLPEISAGELAAWIKTKPELVILDVREANETAYAALPDRRVTYVPLSLLARYGQQALPPELSPQCEMVVLCHLGARSAQVTYWLQTQLGFTQVYNLRGGIDAFAREVDPTIHLY